MERLTIPDKKIPGGTRRTIIDTRAVREEAMTIYWALKKYEDTGLTPEKIERLKEQKGTGEMKQLKSEPVYICSICGKDIAGDHVYIKTRRGTEQHIHYGCMPGRRRDSHGEINTSPQ